METIIFLPGLSIDERIYAHQIETFKNNYNCHTIICSTDNTMQGLVDHVVTQAPEKFIVVGHSFGGMVAQWLAIQHPEKISKLILIGTGPGKLTPELKKIFTEMLIKAQNNQIHAFFDSILPATIHKDRINDTTLIDTIKVMQTSFPPEALINQIQVDLEGKDATPFLKNIKCSTLLIYGKQDPFYQEECVLLRQLIPNNDYVEIDHCGHMTPLERPEAVSAIMNLWLDMNKN